DGSQKYNGNTADLIPKPTKNSKDVTVTSPLFSTKVILFAISAMFKVPVIPYKTAIAVRKITEANMFIVTYLIAPSICIFLPPTVNNINEDIITTSNQT